MRDWAKRAKIDFDCGSLSGASCPYDAAVRHVLEEKFPSQKLAWLFEHQTKLELVFLPSYSPQLNPVDYRGRRCVLQGVHTKSPSRSCQQLHHRVLCYLHKLQKLSARVRSYFQHPEIAYAA